MKISHNLARGIDLVDLSISELRALKKALSFFAQESGVKEAFHAEQAEALSGLIPDVVYMADVYECPRCRVHFYDDEIRIEKVGRDPRAQQIQTCPHCGEHKIHKVERLPQKP